MHLSMIAFFIAISICLHYVASTGCEFSKSDKSEEVDLKFIESLRGKRFSASDDEYNYFLGICTKATGDTIAGVPDNAGLYQLEKKGSGSGKVIGRFTSTAIIKGTDWLILEYMDGEPYENHCGKESRRARIMINCDSSINPGEETLNIFEEERNKTGECYYLFEMPTSVLCKKEPTITIGMSVGSVLVIVFVVVVLLYLILGFLYNRFVLRARGIEQLPNYEFWKDFGNLEADGCNLVCRSKSNSSKSYRGIGDDQLGDDLDERNDDHLLPM